MCDVNERQSSNTDVSRLSVFGLSVVPFFQFSRYCWSSQEGDTCGVFCPDFAAADERAWEKPLKRAAPAEAGTRGQAAVGLSCRSSGLAGVSKQQVTWGAAAAFHPLGMCVCAQGMCWVTAVSAGLPAGDGTSGPVLPHRLYQPATDALPGYCGDTK